MRIGILTSFLFVLTCLSCAPDEEAVAPEPLEEILLRTLTLEEKIGQLLLVDLYDEEKKPILKLSVEDAARITALTPGGIVFYGANIDSVDQIRNLTESLQETASIPLFLAVDHEGGIVNRLDDSGNIDATELPSAKTVGVRQDLEWAHRIATVMGEELAAMGFNMNFAPVADILSTSDSVIGSRSYGADPESVSAMVAMTVLGLQEQGVSSVLKHFPGHGEAVGDTHSGLVYLPKSLMELSTFEFIPFSAGILAGADGIMAAHIVIGRQEEGYPPATLSARLLTGALRKELEFDGLVITDSLTMKAMANIEAPAVLALLAGADMILRPHDAFAVKARILAAVADGTIAEERIDNSVRRIIRIKIARGIGTPLPPHPELIIGSPEHRAEARKSDAEETD